MMILLITLVLNSISVNPQHNDSGCADAYSESQYAYDYCKKAYEAQSLDSLFYYTKKAMTAFDDASIYAEECNCGDASISADDGYKNAKKAHNAENLEKGQSFAKKAIKSADDAMLYLEDCDKE